METHNPYAAPSAVLSEVELLGDDELAGRGTRLAAIIIDTVVQIAVMLPIMFAGGYLTYLTSGQKPSWGTTALWSVAGFVAFVAVQGYPLATGGQTWGKKLLKVRIVDLAGNKPDLVSLLGLRYGVLQVIGLLPIVGPMYTVVDALFIFSKDRRCLHDKIAGTRVTVVR